MGRRRRRRERKQLQRNTAILERVYEQASEAPRFVENPRAPNWGIGRVIAEDATHVRVRFLRAGTKRIAKRGLSLEEVAPSFVLPSSPLWDLPRSRGQRSTGGAAHPAPLGVLFVNIGWSARYDGSPVAGGHGWFRRPDGASVQGCSEEELFLADEGRYRGPAGEGAIPPFVRIDVVFVARPPNATGHRIVAVFRDCRIEPHHANPTDLLASSSDVDCFSTRRRKPVTWPGKMAMRRWAVGGPSRNWPELYATYQQLVERTRSS